MVIILGVLSCGPLNLHIIIIIIARQVVSPLPIAAQLRNRHCYATYRRVVRLRVFSRAHLHKMKSIRRRRRRRLILSRVSIILYYNRADTLSSMTAAAWQQQLKTAVILTSDREIDLGLCSVSSRLNVMRITTTTSFFRYFFFIEIIYYLSSFLFRLEIG